MSLPPSNSVRSLPPQGEIRPSLTPLGSTATLPVPRGLGRGIVKWYTMATPIATPRNTSPFAPRGGSVGGGSVGGAFVGGVVGGAAGGCGCAIPGCSACSIGAVATPDFARTEGDTLYEADVADTVDLMMQAALVDLNREVQARLNVQRLGPCEYIVEGVRVAVSLPLRETGGERELIVHVEDGGWVRLAAYLRQVANVGAPTWELAGRRTLGVSERDLALATVAGSCGHESGIPTMQLSPNKYVQAAQLGLPLLPPNPNSNAVNERERRQFGT